MKRSSVMLVLALAALSTGCIGGAVVQRTHYALGYPMDKVSERLGTTHPAVVLVRRFTSELAYDKYEIVFRENPYAFGYYTYKLWASKPRKMLQQLVVKHLREAAVVTEVIERLEDTPPTYELDSEVTAIEEINSSEELWLARLGMRFTLKRHGFSKVIWSFDFDEQRPVPERSPFFVVKTMSEILESQLTLAGQDLDERLTTVEAAGGGVDVPPVLKRPKVPKPAAVPQPGQELPVEPGSQRIR